jgi:hypothetical protein
VREKLEKAARAGFKGSRFQSFKVFGVGCGMKLELNGDVETFESSGSSGL